MAGRPASIAIIGAGIGGLTAAATLGRAGFDVRIYEQAQHFARVGAGIQLTANAVKALRPLGIEDHLRRRSFIADAAINGEWDTGEITNVLEMGAALEARYGAPDLMMHRATLHEALAGLVPAELISFGRKLSGVGARGSGAVTLAFADGGTVEADAVIGADGIHSVVREALFGTEQPRFTGRVAYRTTFPAARLGGLSIDARAKWWGPDRHIVHYYTTAAHDEVYFIAATPEPDFAIESWSAKGDPDALLAAFQGFHPTARAILAVSPDVRKWALVERDPMPRWHEGRVVLLGDACHPTTPYMAQGAASAIEDAVVLTRCLGGVEPDGFAAAFRRYAANRRGRTARIQLTNRQNTWMKFKTDTDWVYAYDAWTVPLMDPDAAVPLRSPEVLAVENQIDSL
jgi:6-hydroxynicotinate 3-monooxygenase